METLDFTLTPEAAAKVHDILMCLAKFSDTVTIEARRERVSSYLLMLEAHFLLKPKVVFHSLEFLQIRVCLVFP